MKKSLRNIIILLLSTVAAVCVAAGFIGCSETVKLESLTVEDARTVFLIGDEFEYGENFKVYANYTDGTKTDVTEEVEIRKESGFDMNVAGNYQLTVVFGNKREVYTIYVNDFESPLRKIELNISKVKTSFELGESISLEGLIITSTYENAQGGLITSTSSSLRNLTVEITDADGNKMSQDEVFSSLGEYTVTVSSGSVKDSYKVSVQGINISTVQGALAVGNFFKEEVVSGTQKVREALVGGEFHDSFDYDYEFGKNYFRMNEKTENPSVRHCSIDDEGIFCVTIKDDEVVNNNQVQADMMNGAPVLLWYYGLTEFGIEDALNNLYAEALKCTNKDLKETADEENRKYSFSFSGLVFRSNDANYFETTAEFSLGDKYNIENVKFIQTFWENNTTAEGLPGWTLNFKTDENGITKPLARFTHKLEVTVQQTTGLRTAENPYTRSMFRIQDYKLLYDGKELGDNGTVNCIMDEAKLKLNIDITDIAPADTGFDIDAMYFSLEGNPAEVDSATFLYADGVMASRKDNTIEVIFEHGGVFTLILKTTDTRKTITFDVVGLPPTSISGMIYNDSAEFFSSAINKTVAINGVVYFYGAVNEYANPAQTAMLSSGNANNATIERAKISGIDCFKFTANKEGVYKVIVSDVTNTHSCEFTFTVSDIPDYSELLNGRYSVTDAEGSIFTVDFTPESELSGTVLVTKTPVDREDGTPLPNEAKSANYSYAVDIDNLEIKLTLASGTNLGLSFTVDPTNRLILIDQYGDRNILVPVL